MKFRARVARLVRMHAVIGIVVVACGFGLVELVFAATRAPREAGSRRVDVAYLLLARVTDAVAKVLVVLVILGTAIVAGWRGGTLEHWLLARTFVFARLPHVVQMIVALVVLDFYGYWIHRMLHMPRLWRFHAVHHSSTRLDWLAAARNHPACELFSRAAILPPIVALGIDVRVLAGVFPILGFMGLFIHANVRWRFGALRYVIATPLFHRWHHAMDLEARDTNFAGLFPIWDVLFGTFHCPDRQPATFGAEGVPRGFLEQMAYPFRGSSGAPTP